MQQRSLHPIIIYLSTNNHQVFHRKSTAYMAMKSKFIRNVAPASLIYLDISTLAHMAPGLVHERARVHASSYISVHGEGGPTDINHIVCSKAYSSASVRHASDVLCCLFCHVALHQSGTCGVSGVSESEFLLTLCQSVCNHPIHARVFMQAVGYGYGSWFRHSAHLISLGGWHAVMFPSLSQMSGHHRVASTQHPNVYSSSHKISEHEHFNGNAGC